MTEPFRNRWFSPVFDSLERLENRLERAGVQQLLFGEGAAGSVDNMPAYSVQTFRKQVTALTPNLGIGRIHREEDLTTKMFGQILGAKVSVFTTWRDNVRQWRQLGPAKRAELPPGFDDAFRQLEKLVEIADSSLAKLVLKAFRRVRSESLGECAEFFEGYGLGLGFMPRIHSLLAERSRPSLPKFKRDLMTLYISQYWAVIEDGREHGGWPRIVEDFQSFVAGISEDLEIDEETFRKALQRAGIKSVGRVGAPRKQGQTKTPGVPK